MENINTIVSAAVPPKYHGLVSLLLVLCFIAGRTWQAIRTGRNIISAIFLGTNSAAAQPAPVISKPRISLMLLIGLATIAAVSGCKNLETTAYKTSTGVQITVSTAMSAYSDWLKLNPNTPDSTRLAVAQAYAKYQAAALTVVDAEQTLGTINATNIASLTTAQGQLNSAAQQADQALGDLIGLLRTFGVKI